MSRTYSKLISEGDDKLKLLLEPVSGTGADVFLRMGGFYAGFERLEDLLDGIESEHSKRTTASGAIADDRPQALSTNSSAGDAHARCSVSERVRDSGSVARGHSVKSEDSGQPGKDIPIVAVAGPSPSLDADAKLPSDQIIGEPGLQAEEEFEGNVDDFNVKNSMLEPVSILDLQYEVSEEVQPSSYLYGSLNNQKLKMQKISHFKFWFDDKWKREPEVWISVEQHGLVRLGIPAVQYRSIFDAVVLVARYLYQAMKDPLDTSIFDNLRGTYEHYRNQDIEAEVARHKSFVALFSELNPDVKRSKAVMELLSPSSKNEASANDSRSLLSSSGKKRKKLILDESDESEQESRKEEEQKNDPVDSADVNSFNADVDSPDADVDSPDADSLSDPICALCDDGGDVTFCDGPCLRAFHATRFRGKDSRCPSLKYSMEEIENLESKELKFLCGNCQRGKHQCFCCKKLGSSSGPEEGLEEVFQCQDKACGKFYHLSCLKVADRVFTCPAHLCASCEKQREESLVKCRLCPKAWHTECIPRDINFEEDTYFNNPRRGWVLGDSIVMYCSDHEYDFDLGMPARAPVDFAEEGEHRLAPQQPVVESSLVQTSEKPESRQGVQDIPRCTDREEQNVPRRKQGLRGHFRSRGDQGTSTSKLPSTSNSRNMGLGSVEQQDGIESEILVAKAPTEGGRGPTLLSPGNSRRRPAVLLSDIPGGQQKQKQVGRIGNQNPNLQDRSVSTSAPLQTVKKSVDQDPSLVVSNVLKRKVPSKLEAKKKVEYLQFSPPKRNPAKGWYKAKPGGATGKP